MFSPKCRAKISHLGHFVNEEFRRSVRTKQNYTSLSRRDNYLRFCHNMCLDDPSMASQPSSARDYFLACYTVSLVQGETINGSLIKYTTITKYLDQAYTFFGPHDYTSDNDFVGTVLKSVQSYEEVPKRRRMITDVMMQWLIEEASSEGADTPTRAIVDWIILSRYAGFRAGEWSQTTLTKYARIDEWPGRPSKAMTRLDFTFLGDRERHLPENNLTPSQVRYLAVTWRWQKNGQNGQQVTFADDPNNHAYSATRAGLRIYHRSRRLGMKPDEPMGVFRDTRGKVKFITDGLVNSLLRKAAQSVLNLTPKDPALSLWSTHSIRVTAANLLYR